jgi:hypothetical protein
MPQARIVVYEAQHCIVGVVVMMSLDLTFDSGRVEE